jgi:predicted RNA-binding protein with RPS1 domain
MSAIPKWLSEITDKVKEFNRDTEGMDYDEMSPELRKDHEDADRGLVALALMMGTIFTVMFPAIAPYTIGAAGLVAIRKLVDKFKTGTIVASSSEKFVGQIETTLEEIANTASTGLLNRDNTTKKIMESIKEAQQEPSIESEAQTSIASKGKNTSFNPALART